MKEKRLLQAPPQVYGDSTQNDINTKAYFFYSGRETNLSCMDDISVVYLSIDFGLDFSMNLNLYVFC